MKYTLYYTAGRALAGFASTVQIAQANCADGTLSFVSCADDVSPNTHDWLPATLSWSLNPARTLSEAKAAAKVALKASAERRKMVALTPGGAKKRVYSRKDEEVRNWWGLLPGVQNPTTAALLQALGLLPQATQQRLFRFAIWDMRIRGEPTIAPAIARFEAGMASDETVARLEAIEQERCAAIDAAATVADAWARAAAVDWNRTI